MSVFLTSIDSVPIQGDDLSFELKSWLTQLVDSLNETNLTIQNGLNGVGGLQVPTNTMAEIVTMSATANPGSIWYCTDSSPPTLVFLSNGALVKPTVTSFP